MRKLYAIIFTQIIFHTAFAQLLNIDSLKKVLPSIHDTARIICLHQLTVQYLFEKRMDSVNYYLNIAYKESIKKNYIHGLVLVALSEAAVEYYSSNNNDKTEGLIKKSLYYFNQTPNKKEINVAYWWLGRIQKNKCNYDEALTNLQLAYQLSIKDDDHYYQWDAYCLESITDIYRDRGDYTNLLNTQEKLISAEKKSGDTGYYSFHELWVLGLMYKLMGEYSTALPFWRHLFFNEMNGFGITWNQMEYAELLTYANQPDSALYYYNKFDSAKASIKDIRYFLVSKGEFYLYLKQYQTALPYFQKGLIYHQQLNDLVQTKRSLLDIAKTFAALGKYDSAINYAKQALSIAIPAKSLPSMRDGYEVLYNVYDHLHQTDSAYNYYRRFISKQETVLNNQTMGKMAAYDYEHKIKELNSEKQLQQQSLKSESTQKNILIAGMVLLFLLSFIVFRNFMLKRRNEKLESEKKQSALFNKASELEMQALRSQMNPHFIFNSLNSINRFILQNERAQASEYLTKFSKLVRLILQNSQSELIPLERELESLNLYLELEALRFNYHFDYKISFNKDLDVSALQVPPLILQPYAENAIWHGLMHKEEKGLLNIEVAEENNQLYFKITDDGIGRKNAAAFASKSATKHKSMGLQITENRIAIMQQPKTITSPVTINDLSNADGSAAGTEVIIKLPVIYD